MCIRDRYIDGRLEYDTYERDGVVIPTAEVIVREVVMLNSKEVPGDEALDEVA